MNSITVLLVILNLGLAISMLGVSFWIIIPRGISYLRKWRNNQNPTSFSVGIFCFFISILFMSFVSIWGSRKINELLEYFSGGYIKLILFLIMSYFLIYFSIPKALFFYQKWKSKGGNNSLSVFLLFSFVSVFLMYSMFNIYLPAFAR